MVQLILADDLLFDDPSGPVAIGALSLFVAVIDGPKTAARFADGDFHRLSIERDIIIENTERKFRFCRFHKDPSCAGTLGTRKTIAFEIHTGTKPLALLADLDFHLFGIKLHLKCSFLVHFDSVQIQGSCDPLLLAAAVNHCRELVFIQQCRIGVDTFLLKQLSDASKHLVAFIRERVRKLA